jgi:putative SOS response-associated peptidase YedK
MCYTIAINLTRELLQKRFNATLDPDLPFRKSIHISAFGLPECPVICSDNRSTIKLFRWGLIPVWTADEKYAAEIRTKTFNAKAETISQKPSYRHLITTRKCLILTSGFYEWQARGKEKQPYFIKVKDAEAFALAGLYDHWTNPASGEIINSFTIITTQANPLMEKIHNTKKRMPVILSEKDEIKWIDAELSLEETLQMLKPFEEDKMQAEEVNKKLFARKTAEPDQTLF